jgi:hypothetical protein
MSRAHDGIASRGPVGLRCCAAPGIRSSAIDPHDDARPDPTCTLSRRTTGAAQPFTHTTCFSV